MPSRYFGLRNSAAVNEVLHLLSLHCEVVNLKFGHRYIRKRESDPGQFTYRYYILSLIPVLAVALDPSITLSLYTRAPRIVLDL